MYNIRTPALYGIYTEPASPVALDAEAKMRAKDLEAKRSAATASQSLQTIFFGFLRGFGLFVVLCWPAPWNRAVCSRLQINIDVIKVAHHVLILPERRHDIVLRRADILAASGDDA